MPAYKDKETGGWNCSFYYKDWTGKTKRKHSRGFTTKKEAQNYETEFKRVAHANMDMKFSSFVDIYFADKEGELKARSIKNKRYMVDKHVTPYLGEKRMNEITPSDIITWQNTIREENDYSPSYLRMIQNQLNAIMSHAGKIYSLSNNPCGKVKKMGRSDDRSLNFWTEEEYSRFISTFKKSDRGYLMFEILFWTGIREGELLALSMDDIDLVNARMNIKKTYYRHKKEDVITEPKTENSVRSVDLPGFLVEEIKAYYKMLYNYPENERLFPVVAEAVQHMMKRHIEKAGVKQIRVHDLRHSHVAYLIHKGIQPLIIKERLGHKDIKVTLNTYGHLYPSEQKRVAALLDENRKENKEGGNVEEYENKKDCQ